MTKPKKSVNPAEALARVKKQQESKRVKQTIEFLRHELEDMTDKVYAGSKYVHAKREAYQEILRRLTGEE